MVGYSPLQSVSQASFSSLSPVFKKRLLSIHLLLDLFPPNSVTILVFPCQWKPNYSFLWRKTSPWPSGHFAALLCINAVCILHQSLKHLCAFLMWETPSCLVWAPLRSVIFPLWESHGLETRQISLFAPLLLQPSPMPFKHAGVLVSLDFSSSHSCPLYFLCSGPIQSQHFSHWHGSLPLLSSIGCLLPSTLQVARCYFYDVNY